MSSTVNQVEQQVRDALAEFEQLSQSSDPPSQVIQQMLQLLVAAAGSRGAVAWMPSDQQGSTMSPVGHVGIAKDLILNQQGDPFPEVVNVLREVWKQGKALIAAPGQAEFGDTQLFNHTQFFVPIIGRESRSIGLVQLIDSEDIDPKLYRNYASLAQHAAKSLGDYLSSRQTELEQRDTAGHAALLRLIHQLVKPNHPQDVIEDLANLSRPLLDAYRVAVVGYWKGKPSFGVSDALQPNRKAVLIRTIETLAAAARERQVPLTYARGQELHGEDEWLGPQVEELFTISVANAICLIPLKHDDEVIGVIAVEYEQPEHASRRSSMQQDLALHAGPVLQKAITWWKRPLRHISNGLVYLKEHPAKSSVIGSAVGIVILLLVWSLFFMQIELTVKVNGRLEPAQLATISAGKDGGLIDAVHVKRGQTVVEGDVLVSIDSTDLRLQFAETIKQIDQETVAIQKARTESDPQAMRTAELKAQQLQIERARLERRIDQSQVRSPISGIILTERPERLTHMSVAQGQTLLELGDLTHFDMVMHVPEEDLALVQEQLIRNKTVPVTFISRTWPDRVLTAEVTDFASLSPATKMDEEEGRHVFQITIPVRLDDTGAKLALANPTGRAKLELGESTVVFRYGRRALRFLQMTILF